MFGRNAVVGMTRFAIAGLIVAGIHSTALAVVTFDDHFTNGNPLDNGDVGGDWTEQSQGMGFRVPATESGTSISLPDAVGDWNVSAMRTTDGFKWGGSTVTVTLNELQFTNAADSRDEGAGFPWEGHAFITIAESANSQPGINAYNNDNLPALSIAIGDDGISSGFAVSVAGSGNHSFMPVSGGIFDSFIDASNPLEITIATNFDGSFSASFNRTYGGGLSAPILGNAVGGLAVDTGPAFDVAIGAQGIGASELVAVFDRVIVDESPFDQVPKVQINQQTGQVTLVNGTENALALAAYSLTSEAGTLNASSWTPISGTRDGNASGTIDDEPWTITGQAPGELSEESAGTASFAASQEIALGDAFLQSPYEDVEFTYSTDGVNFLPALEEYVGTSIAVGDFNADDNINDADWAIFVQNYGQDVSSLSIAESHVLGDMNGDGQIRLADYTLFATAYAAANPGAGALAFPQSVPEPSTLLLAFGVSLCVCRLRHKTVALAFFLLCVSLPCNSYAVTVFDDHFTNGNVFESDGVGGDWADQTQAEGFREPPSESGSLVTLPDVESGWNKSVIRTADGFAWGGGSVAITLSELVFADRASSADRGAGFAWSGHASIGIADSANPELGFDAYNNGNLPAMTIEIGDDEIQSGFAIQVPGAGNDTGITVVGAGVFDSFIAPGNPLEITVATSSDGSFSVSFNQTYGGGMSAPIVGNAVGGLSSTPGATFDVGIGSQGVADTQMSAVFDRVVVDEPTTIEAPKLQVNMTNGMMTLMNGGATAIELNGYEIESASGALNVSGNVTGDYNNSGAVDEADYDEWKASFGSTSNLSADGNGDGIVDAADYTVWRDNLGATGGSGGWNSFDDQNLDSTGLGLAEGWAELGTPSPDLIAEAFLTGGTMWDPEEELSLGTAFVVGSAQDLVFRYSTTSGALINNATVEYVSGAVAGSVPVPEPATLSLVALILFGLTGWRMSRSRSDRR